MQNYEKKIDNLFISWLSLSLILIFFTIIIGGLTRLTNSGLSITEWELFKGIFPPLNKSSWDNYFELYKQIPQFKLLNTTMTLEEFKIIFYWEYFHRILGRVIGLFFLIPLIYFHLTRRVEFRIIKYCYLIFFLILLQGFIGWYMVTSGLVNDVTVSHYRLSLHLITALTIISIIFWLIINLKLNTNKRFFSFNKYYLPYLFLISFIFFQILVGAFVSGLDAGNIYQTWPLMGSSYIPDDLILFKLQNLVNFDSHSLVQFYHRNLAYFITIYILILGFIIFKNQQKDLYKPLLILLIVLLLQIFLGITTLISGLNIYLASGHQICSVLLVFSSINLYYHKIK